MGTVKHRILEEETQLVKELILLILSLWLKVLFGFISVFMTRVHP